MADQFVSEIRMFAGNFAPLGWALCNGQLIPISQNTALFALLGTNFGGNGQTTFGLPNMQGRAPMFFGQGPGLSPRVIGEQAGSETVTLLQTEMPLHNHAARASSQAGNSTSPSNAVWASSAAGRTPPPLYSNSTNTTMAASAAGLTGGNQPHNNMQPYLVVTFIIAQQGIFPSRA
jgi:microcystin-dependent protein